MLGTAQHLKWILCQTLGAIAQNIRRTFLGAIRYVYYHSERCVIYFKTTKDPIFLCAFPFQCSLSCQWFLTNLQTASEDSIQEQKANGSTLFFTPYQLFKNIYYLLFFFKNTYEIHSNFTSSQFFNSEA